MQDGVENRVGLLLQRVRLGGDDTILAWGRWCRVVHEMERGSHVSCVARGHEAVSIVSMRVPFRALRSRSVARPRSGVQRRRGCRGRGEYGVESRAIFPGTVLVRPA